MLFSSIPGVAGCQRAGALLHLTCTPKGAPRPRKGNIPPCSRVRPQTSLSSARRSGPRATKEGVNHARNVNYPRAPTLNTSRNKPDNWLRDYLQADASAVDQFREAQVTYATQAAKLAQAQLVIAREYGFHSWANLKIQVGTLSDDPVEALTGAIKANDAPLVRQVLARYPALKSTLNEPLPNYSFETPAIVAAVYKDNREMVDALLAAGADINARSKWWAGGFGVLDCSSEELTRYLIQRGAYVDIHAAARPRHVRSGKRIIRRRSRDWCMCPRRGWPDSTTLRLQKRGNRQVSAAPWRRDRRARCRSLNPTAAQSNTWPRTGRGGHEVARYLIARGDGARISSWLRRSGDLELVRSASGSEPTASVWVSVAEKYFPKRNPASGGHIYIFSFGWTKMAHMLAARVWPSGGIPFADAAQSPFTPVCPSLRRGRGSAGQRRAQETSGRDPDDAQKKSAV